MNKQDLLDALATKFYLVLTPALQRTEGSIKWYLAGVYDKSTDNLIRKNIAFYVEDEGLGTEAAFWGSGEPKPSQSDNFTTLVAAYISNRISDATIKEGNIERVSEADKTAIVRVIIDEAGILKEYRLLINESAPDVLQYTKVGVSL